MARHNKVGPTYGDNKSKNNNWKKDSFFSSSSGQSKESPTRYDNKNKNDSDRTNFNKYNKFNRNNLVGPNRKFDKPKNNWNSKDSEEQKQQSYNNPSKSNFFVSTKENFKKTFARSDNKNKDNVDGTPNFNKHKFTNKNKPSNSTDSMNQRKQNIDNSNKFNRNKDDRNRKGSRDESKFKGGKVEKKPFNKQQWRLKTYSRKYRIDQWEEKRKKAVLREYYKEINDDKPKLDVKKIYEEASDESSSEEDVDAHKYVKNPNYKPEKNIKSKKEKQEIIIPKNEDPEENLGDNNKPNKQKLKTKAYKKANAEFERLNQEKAARKEEHLKQQAEKLEALKNYKKKKNEKFKKLNKKTKRGQPIMKDRIEMLLEKIQSG